MNTINETEGQPQVGSDALLAEIRKALKSADDAQAALARDDASNGLYYVNGVQDRLKRILESYSRLSANVQTVPTSRA